MHVFEFLKRPLPKPPRFLVLYGGEAFLQRLGLQTIRKALSDGEEPIESTYSGDTVTWRDLRDELSTQSLFGQGKSRLVVVDDADKFVSANRDALEGYAAKPRQSAVLVLLVEQFPKTTRLFKAVEQLAGAIHCGPPQKKQGRKSIDDAKAMVDWLQHWAEAQHQAKLQPRAAALLLEIRGTEFGLLDQELAKLALFAGIGGEITMTMVRDIVGGWKGQTIWELLDAALDGDAREALHQLDRLLQGGEVPVALFGQISWSVRRFAAATYLFERELRQGRRPRVRDVLAAAGFRDWPQGQMEQSERQLKKLGRRRGSQLYRRLLELDLSLKGTHSSPDRARAALEQFVLGLAIAPR